MHLDHENNKLLSFSGREMHVCTGSKCESLLDKVNADVSELNLYDILEPCYNGAQPSQNRQPDESTVTHQRPGRSLRQEQSGGDERLVPGKIWQRLRGSGVVDASGQGGRGWPLGGPIIQGSRVPNWTHLLGQSLGEHPPCLDHRQFPSYYLPLMTYSQGALNRVWGCVYSPLLQSNVPRFTIISVHWKLSRGLSE